MEQWPPDVFTNLGILLVSEEYIMNPDPLTIYSPFPNNIKTMIEYNQEYMDKLDVQLVSLERLKKHYINILDDLLISQHKCQEKIEYLNKKALQNKTHSNSAINFITLYNKRVEQSLHSAITLYGNNQTKIGEIKKEIDQIDYCIYKTLYYKKDTKICNTRCK
jgi:hypothetical protein